MDFIHALNCTSVVFSAGSWEVTNHLSGEFYILPIDKMRIATAIRLMFVYEITETNHIFVTFMRDMIYGKYARGEGSRMAK